MCIKEKVTPYGLRWKANLGFNLNMDNDADFKIHVRTFEINSMEKVCSRLNKEINSMHNQLRDKQSSISRSLCSKSVCEMWQELKSKGIAVKESLMAKHYRKINKLKWEQHEKIKNTPPKHVVDTSYQQPINSSQNTLTED